MLRAGAGAAGAAAADRASPGRSPHRAPAWCRRPRPVRPAGRRASPVIAGPLAVLLVVAVVVVGALLVAALPGGDTGGLAVATTTPAPTRTPAATARPTATVRPSSEADRRAPPPPRRPRPGSRRRPAGDTGDLCDPILGFACGLGAGRYEPSGFTPAIRFAPRRRLVDRARRARHHRPRAGHGRADLRQRAERGLSLGRQRSAGARRRPAASSRRSSRPTAWPPGSHRPDASTSVAPRSSTCR